jgi:4-amino-4-deoxy-L-arabinose transferase-like glycosyltransferase
VLRLRLPCPRRRAGAAAASTSFTGLVWAIAVLPHLSLRCFMWEEGNNAELARDVLMRGDWLAPAIFGLRYVEKPPLFAWLIAGTASLTGRVNEWSARLPAILAVLGTALLVERLTRRYATVPAALFAAGAFMFSPLVLRKLMISEPDTLVTFLSFAAFAVWWDGETAERVTAGRWLACGGLLTALALIKGPQPIGFFALGAGASLVARRRWHALAGFALCLALPAAATIAWAGTVYRPGDLPVWLGYMRLEGTATLSQYLRERARFAGSLPLDLLPSTFVLASVYVLRDRRSDSEVTARPVLRALALYAGLCTLALLVWPGTKTRYAMPVAPAVAVMAGLTIGSLWRRRHWAGVVAVALAGILFAYQVALVTVVLPRFTEEFDATRHLGVTIDAVVREAPAPLFTIEGPHANKLFYVTWPIRALLLPAAATLPAPAWVVLSQPNLEQIETTRPDLVFQVMATRLPPDLVLARVERRPVEDDSLHSGVTEPGSGCWR